MVEWLLANEIYVRMAVVAIITIIAILSRSVIVTKTLQIIRRFSKVQLIDELFEKYSKTTKPLTYLVGVLFFQIALNLILFDSIDSNVTGLALQIIKLLHMIPFSIIYLVLIGFFLNGVFEVLSEQYKKSPANELTKNLDATLLHMTFKVARILVLIIIGGMIFTELGYNVSAIFAGLGLGGVALALAAQDTVSNLFGCVVILLDKPFEINDWIQTSDVEGIVEDINFRSTRIRTFKNALVSVPNSTIASSLITNWTKMERRKLIFYINLTYSTSAKQIQDIEKDLVDYLEAASFTTNGSVKVTFEEMSSSSLDLRVALEINKSDLASFLDAREKINFKALEIVEKHQAGFAFPSQSIYIESMPSIEK